MTQKEVDVHTLELDDATIWLGMGIHEGECPDEMTRSLTEEMKEELFSIAKPKFCYTFTQRVDFKYGLIIAEALKAAERYAIVVSTAGQEVDDLLHRYRDENIVKAFVADTIASEIVEATSRQAIEEITAGLDSDEHISNSYSPGYCGWPLTDQRKLFAFFNEPPCGVRLNNSCLMLPIKSVSAVLAIGQKVAKSPYGCAICTKKDCYKKRPTR